MKKMSELMKELGFNPNSATSAQEAFIKNLMKSAYGINVITPSEKKEIQSNPEKIKSHPEMEKLIDLKTNLAIYAWHCEHHLAHIMLAKQN